MAPHNEVIDAPVRFDERRKIAQRICVAGVIMTTTPCHLGGSETEASIDQTLVRNAEGRPYLPGSTLAGLLRAMMPGGEAPKLFGATWGDPTGSQSPLIVEDGHVVGQEGVVATELRDGVAIEPSRGVAEDGKKFDVELLPEGTRLRVSFELVLDGTKGDSERKAWMAWLLRAMEEGRLRLGKRTRRGWGQTVVLSDGRGAWTVETFDVGTRNGVLCWLQRGLPQPPRGWPTGQRPVNYKNASDVANAWGVRLPDAQTDLGLEVVLALRVAGALVVRSEGYGVDEPDAVHLRRRRAETGALTAVLPGTSLAGVLRHRCLRIAKTLAPESHQAAAKALVDGMFGRLERGEGYASRVEVDEAKIVGGRYLRHTRLKIDPWTGGALESYLFTEDLQFGGDVDVTVRLRPSRERGAAPEVAERALLLLALRDLACGDLTVGGEGGSGRGRLAPRNTPGRLGTVTVKASGAAPVTVALNTNREGVVTGRPPEAFNPGFEALRAHLGAPNS